MRKLFIAASLAAALGALPAAAGAQVLLTPFAGATFGGDSTDARPTGGVSLLFMGAVAGVELEFGYTPDFFNESSEIRLIDDSNVTSLSANLLIGVGAGPVRPYAAGGLGLVRSRVGTVEDFFDGISQNDFGFNAGGGLIVLFNRHIGLRGDLRYFRSLQSIDVGDLSLTLGDLDYWRAYGGLVIGF